MRRDRLIAFAFLAKALHGAKLVERMQRFAEGILGERVFFGENRVGGRLDDAGNRNSLRRPLAPYEACDREIAAATRRNLEHSGLVAAFVNLRPHIEAGEQAAALNVAGQVFDGHTVLHAADIGL